MSGFDALDRSILEILNHDARKSSAQIARELGIAERTVHHRIQRLKNLDVLKTVAVINPSAFGYNLFVDIFCEVDLGFQEQALEALQSMPEICYLALSTGDQDISLQALFKNSDEMHRFITHKLHQVPGMRRTRTVLVPRILKDTYEWLPSPEAFDNHTEDRGNQP